MADPLPLLRLILFLDPCSLKRFPSINACTFSSFAVLFSASDCFSSSHSLSLAVARFGAIKMHTSDKTTEHFASFILDRRTFHGIFSSSLPMRPYRISRGLSAKIHPTSCVSSISPPKPLPHSRLTLERFSHRGFRQNYQIGLLASDLDNVPT